MSHGAAYAALTAAAIHTEFATSRTPRVWSLWSAAVIAALLTAPHSHRVRNVAFVIMMVHYILYILECCIEGAAALGVADVAVLVLVVATALVSTLHHCTIVVPHEAHDNRDERADEQHNAHRDAYPQEEIGARL